MSITTQFKHAATSLLLGFALAVFTTAKVQANAGEGNALLTKADEYRSFRGQAFSFELTLINREQGQDERAFKLDARILNAHTSLIVYEQPTAEQGKALLMDGSNLWFSTPSTSRPIRITPQQRLLGEVSNGDVASTDFSGDYTAEVAAREAVDNTPAVKLDLSPKAGSMAAYGRVHLWVAEGDSKPLKADFFGPSGKLLKTAHYRKYETLPAKLGGKRQLVELEIINALNPAKSTVMRYADFKLGELPNSMFTTAYLAKLR
jgi:outer membrane lipoprotein-sorting protein